MDLSLCKKKHTFLPSLLEHVHAWGFFQSWTAFPKSFCSLVPWNNLSLTETMCWFHNWPEAIKQSYSLGMLPTVVWKGEKKKIGQKQLMVEWQNT